MIEKYDLYLSMISIRIDKFFKEQAPYIFCKEGCSHCCEKGEYPFSQIEFEYIMKGFETLDENIKMQILENIKRLQKERGHFSEKNFMYSCPFLIDKKCSVYDYRGLICRTHGLAFFDKEKNVKVPNCAILGLNYSSVYDVENKIISLDKFKATGFSQEPLAHNIGLWFLLNNEISNAIGVDFGEEKNLIDWFD